MVSRIIKLGAAAALCTTLLGAAVGARADTINFSQFGSDETELSSPLTGTTVGGVSVTLTSPNGGFQILTQNTSWSGDFLPGSPLLFDGYGPGAVTLTFATPISSLTFTVQTNEYGSFTFTGDAYDGVTLVDTSTVGAYSSYDPGTAPNLTVSGPDDITSVVISTTNDSVGFALYGGAGAPSVPEPASMALLGVGLAGLGLIRRRRA